MTMIKKYQNVCFPGEFKPFIGGNTLFFKVHAFLPNELGLEAQGKFIVP